MASVPPPLPDPQPDLPAPPADPVPPPVTDDPPEAHNRAQDDEPTQAHAVATDRGVAMGDSEKVPTGRDDDDVEDVVDHMRQMVASGLIDMDAYRGERDDDDTPMLAPETGEDIDDS